MPLRVLFLGIPADPVELTRWTQLRTSITVAGIETTCSIELDAADCVIVTEDVLDGFCAAAEAAALQTLRDQGVTFLCASGDHDRILSAIHAIRALATHLEEPDGSLPQIPAARAS